MDIALPGFTRVTSPVEEHTAHEPAAASLAEAIPRIYGYFYPRVGGDRALAEDLTQDTMLSAVRSPNTPEHPEEQIRWLYGIARNRLIDHYRKQGRERTIFGARLDVEDPGEQPGLPDLNLESLPVRQEVITVLGALSPRYRAAIVLKYLDGLDVESVGAALFLSESATQSLLARARNAFRSIWIARNGDTR